MALNFPSNPQINDEYTLNNTTWAWDGLAWNVTLAASQSQANAFKIVSVAGQPSIVADSAEDILTLVAGNNVSITTDSNNDTVTINSGINLTNVFTIAADDSTQVQVNLGETVKFIGGAGIETETDNEGNVTITSTFAESGSFAALSDADLANLTVDQIYEPAIAMLRVDNVGTTAYTFNSHYSGNNPTIYALAGTTIAFHLAAIPGLPFQIQDPTGVAYHNGCVHVSIDGTV
jgi:hypothetical protein